MIRALSKLISHCSSTSSLFETDIMLCTFKMSLIHMSLFNEKHAFNAQTPPKIEKSYSLSPDQSWAEAQQDTVC